MAIGKEHAPVPTGKIRSSEKLPCPFKWPSDQINPELVANAFKKYCILVSMDGTHFDTSTKKNLKIGKTLKVKNRLNMAQRMAVTLECKNWELSLV